MNEDHPQLRMIYRLASLPERPRLAPGYTMRSAGPSDAQALGRILTGAFEEPWDDLRVREVLLENSEVPKTFVVDFEGSPVATASYQIKPDQFPQSGWVHYVGVDPAHRGSGLGAVVVWEVVSEAVSRGDCDVLLTTDDWRLPAIRTYLRLGFEPDIWHHSHAARWQAVDENLRRVAGL